MSVCSTVDLRRNPRTCTSDRQLNPRVPQCGQFVRRRPFKNCGAATRAHQVTSLPLRDRNLPFCSGFRCSIVTTIACALSAGVISGAVIGFPILAM
jgi:hypothetical protein